MKIKEALKITAAVGMIGLSIDYYCKPQYIEGVVVGESGTIVDGQGIFERSENALFGNESIRFRAPTYVIRFKVDEGLYSDEKVYTFAVKETGQSKLEALSLAIEKGTRIRMTKSDFNKHLKGIVGQIDDSELEVLGKE